MARYRVLIPIAQHGQRIPAGAVVSEKETFGGKKKAPLDIKALLAKGRIEPVPEIVVTTTGANDQKQPEGDESEGQETGKEKQPVKQL